jgi:hypothetical protein
MADRQVSIYVPASDIDRWTTTVLGVLGPTIQGTTFEWCWAANYTHPWDADATADKAPDTFKIENDNKTFGFFVKFRYRLEQWQTFENSVRNVATSRGWFPVFGDYDLVADLGKDRFLATEQTGTTAQPAPRRIQRAELLARFLHQGLLLALDALVQDGAVWRFEHNEDNQDNPTGSTFQSIVHLVCNLTQAATLVRMQSPEGVIVARVTF